MISHNGAIDSDYDSDNSSDSSISLNIRKGNTLQTEIDEEMKKFSVTIDDEEKKSENNDEDGLINVRIKLNSTIDQTSQDKVKEVPIIQASSDQITSETQVESLLSQTADCGVQTEPLGDEFLIENIVRKVLSDPQSLLKIPPNPTELVADRSLSEKVDSIGACIESNDMKEGILKVPLVDMNQIIQTAHLFTKSAHKSAFTAFSKSPAIQPTTSIPNPHLSQESSQFVSHSKISHFSDLSIYNTKITFLNWLSYN